MSDHLLTPAEIEALLGSANPVASAEIVGGFMEKRDFMEERGSHRLSPAEQKRASRLWAIHEQAGRNAGIALSAMLRAAADVRLLGVEAVTCREFVQGMENPTCACILSGSSLPGRFVLEIAPAVLSPMLDRLLGGALEAASPAPRRPMTEIEQRLAMRMAGCFVDELSRAWQSVFDLRLTVEHVETDARWLSIGPLDAEATVAAFDLRLGQVRGAIHFCIPPQVMDVLDRHLLSEAAAAATSYKTQPTADKNLTTADENQSEVTVHLNELRIDDADVASLTVGDIIATEHRIDAPVVVSLDGEPKFLGRLGAIAGRKAVRMEREVDP